MCLWVNNRFIYMENIIKPIKNHEKNNKNWKNHGFFMVFSNFDEKTWFFRFSWKKKTQTLILKSNVSENSQLISTIKVSKLKLFTSPSYIVKKIYFFSSKFINFHKKCIFFTSFLLICFMPTYMFDLYKWGLKWNFMIPTIYFNQKIWKSWEKKLNEDEN